MRSRRAWTVMGGKLATSITTSGNLCWKNINIMVMYKGELRHCVVLGLLRHFIFFHLRVECPELGNISLNMYFDWRKSPFVKRDGTIYSYLFYYAKLKREMKLKMDKKEDLNTAHWFKNVYRYLNKYIINFKSSCLSFEFLLVFLFRCGY